MIQILKHFLFTDINDNLLKIKNAEDLAEYTYIENEQHQTIVLIDSRSINRNKQHITWCDMMCTTLPNYNYIIVKSKGYKFTTDTIVRIFKNLISKNINIKYVIMDLCSIFQQEYIQKISDTNTYSYKSGIILNKHRYNIESMYLHFYTFIKNLHYTELLCKKYNINLIWHCNTGFTVNYVLQYYININNSIKKQISNKINNFDKKLSELFIKKIKQLG